MCIEAPIVDRRARGGSAAFYRCFGAIRSPRAAPWPTHEAGTRDAARRAMLRMKDTNKLFKNVLRAIPYLAPKKTSVLPFVLGAIGVALAGGIAAVMVFSPRTRYRALDIAKDGIGKVRGQLGELGISEKLGTQRGRDINPQTGYANGLGNESDGSYTTGA